VGSRRAALARGGAGWAAAKARVAICLGARGGWRRLAASGPVGHYLGMTRQSPGGDRRADLEPGVGADAALPSGGAALPVGTYAGRLGDVDACVAARVPTLGGLALDVGCGVRVALAADGQRTPFAPTSEELAAAWPGLQVTAADPALPEACVRVGGAWVILDGEGRATACLLETGALGDTVALERVEHHPDGGRVAALCRDTLAPLAERWWREGRAEAARVGRVALSGVAAAHPELLALAGPGGDASAELLDRPVERHAALVGRPLVARNATLQALADAGDARGFDLVRVANVTAFLPDGPASQLLRAAASVAREGAWLVEAGTVALGGGAVLTALALAQRERGGWLPRELWLSAAGTPTFLARGGAELPAVLGARGPELVRALALADRAVRVTGAEPNVRSMAAALRAAGRRPLCLDGASLIGLAVEG
jgi:hypothetical protein